MACDEPIKAPTLLTPQRTLVIEGNSQLLWFDGLLPLPWGSRIEINNLAGRDDHVPLDPERFPTGRCDAGRGWRPGVGGSDSEPRLSPRHPPRAAPGTTAR